VLVDGDYDAMVVDVDSSDDDVVRLEVAITSGPNKGMVLGVRSRLVTTDPLLLLGLPVTLAVRDGTPRLLSPPG